MGGNMRTDAGGAPLASHAFNSQGAILLVMLRKAEKSLNARRERPPHFYIGFVFPASKQRKPE